MRENDLPTGEEMLEDIDTSEKLIEHIGTRDINEFLYIVDEAGKIQNARIENLIRDYVAKDNQRHLLEAGLRPNCPKCGTDEHARKNGKRREVQRYRCSRCGSHFTALSGTLLEKSNYTWEVWCEVVRSMFDGRSLERTRQVLEDDFHCIKINTDTVWLMRMKVMAAIAELPSPVLSGVVQFDDTFLREDQKSSSVLENPLPSSLSKEREPRYGYQPSKLGVRSPEFASVTCAVDATGHCVCRLLSMGTVPIEVLYDFIKDHTRSISFACSDADGNYKTVFKDMGVPHYIRPSDYTDIIKRAGYVQPSKKDKEETAEQRRANKVLLERLWEEGAIDRIENRGPMTYRQFRTLKKGNRLNLARVNELHDKLKMELEKKTRGVSTKMLPFYLAWFEYVRNKRVDLGHKLSSTKDAEAVLVDAVSARRNITLAELHEIRDGEIKLPKPSDRYLHMLMRVTDQVREASGNPGFYFNNEDGIETFNRRKVMANMGMGQLRRLARGVHVKSWREKSRTALISELMKKDDLDEILYLIAAGDASTRVEEPDNIDDDGNPERYDFGHRPAKGLFRSTEAAVPSKARSPLVFLDCETTGTKPDSDEVLSLAIVHQDGTLLYDSYIKPEHRKHWRKAERINHISPRDVADKPTLSDEKEAIEAILSGAGCIVGWNVGFDLKMLYACGIDVPTDGSRRCDLMRAYCRWRSKADPDYTLTKDKLEDAAAYLGLLHNAHNALGDAAVLLQIWEIVAGGFPEA